jgi:ATP-dependent helicase HrpA
LTTRKKSLAALQKLENLRWLLEEYRVSIFAQELGASEPVSPKLLDSLLAEIESLA